jgi:hypothetical protein
VTLNLAFVIINTIASAVIVAAFVHRLLTIKVNNKHTAALAATYLMAGICSAITFGAGVTIIKEGTTNLDRARQTANAESALLMSRLIQLRAGSISLNYGPVSEIRNARDHYFELASARVNTEVATNVAYAALLILTRKRSDNETTT